MNPLNPPAFITFTGADEDTSLAGMKELSAQYPIEWGILFSNERQGQPGEARFPHMDYVQALVSTHLRFSAQLCGEDADQVLAYGRCRHDKLLSQYFERAQINTTRKVNTALVSWWAEQVGVVGIVQSLGATIFPNDESVDWLYDPSVTPMNWPVPPPNGTGRKRSFSYGGGLTADNVKDSIRKIGAKADIYSLNLESSVRNPRDRFDLRRCREVCEAVYGVPAQRRPNTMRITQPDLSEARNYAA